jgi:hypothetical protein
MKKLKAKQPTPKALVKNPVPKKLAPKKLPPKRNNFSEAQRMGYDPIAMANNIKNLGEQYTLLEKISEITNCPVHRIPEGIDLPISVLKEIIEHLE